uniref:Uncharacterized protein n=1 Tax=Anopheles farauti TaxID=69004 RepID=A0A182Q1F7_9DIPT
MAAATHRVLRCVDVFLEQLLVGRIQLGRVIDLVQVPVDEIDRDAQIVLDHRLAGRGHKKLGIRSDFCDSPGTACEKLARSFRFGIGCLVAIGLPSVAGAFIIDWDRATVKYIVPHGTADFEAYERVITVPATVVANSQQGTK